MPNNFTREGARVRVFIAEDHPAFAERCKNILEPEFDVVGIELEGFRVAEGVSELKPDVVVMDMGLAGMSGFGAGEEIKAAALGTKIIYMTVAPDFDLAAEAFRRGATGLVDKTKFPEELLIAVRRAVRGDLYFSAPLLRESRQRDQM